MAFPLNSQAQGVSGKNE